ncbi:16S rRNA (cytosine(1402)-N(4))-methyltransferase [Candidatus Peregrinibacteria bacterium CG10_big_fil_rev_8_21_14_0_10_55_24]|nr:MAG: 16S rRNA (cytosine(1402)-N(4))-methyltransferase [Candidatus Peregrinibacteria bacterium CG10_big_fil_rev_8_21_14_0_10_55_24]
MSILETGFPSENSLNKICIQDESDQLQQALLLAAEVSQGTLHPMKHVPVLFNEVLHVLDPHAGETVFDATLGLAGHARGLLDAVGLKGKLVALDADGENLSAARDLLSAYENVQFHHGNFRDIAQFCPKQVNIIFADLGLSSPHVDDPSRGFSHRLDGPLDLRFDRSAGISAEQLIAMSTPQELTDILRTFGEVKQAQTIAKCVKDAPDMRTTGALKTCIGHVCGFRAPAVIAQVFQALRIAVNSELDALEVLLAVGPTLLAPGGRMAVISYHSLEDRMVKQTFRALATACKDVQTGAPVEEAAYELLTKKPIVPTAREIARNPRARSAKLRAVRRRPLDALHMSSPI